MNKTKLYNLEPTSYEHHFDGKALKALKSTPGLENVIRKFNQYGIEKILKVQHTGSNIKVGPQNFTEIYEVLLNVCDILSHSAIPELYVQWGYSVNAFTAGVEKPIIVLNSGCIDLLDIEELHFLLGHEVGHIKSNHILYYQMAILFPMIGDLISPATLGLGGLLSTGMKLALFNWRRMSELTADRAGLLACQNTDAAIHSLIKMAGLPHKYFQYINKDEFILQAKEFEGYDYDALDKAAKALSIMWESHPWTVMRASEMLKWIESGEYDNFFYRTKGPNKRRINIELY